MQVSAGIYRAESGSEVVYALDCGGGYALMDVGSEPRLASKLEQFEQDGIQPKQIAAVFLTHHHEDHCGALAKFCRELSPRVVAHRLSVEHLRYCPASRPIDRDLVDYTVDDGDEVEIGEIVLRAHHLPGHTADATAWQCGEGLFVGDVIFCDGGIGWMDAHWGSCVGDYRASLSRLLELKVTTIYPGHRECGPLRRETVEEALRHLKVLAATDGNPIAALGRPAPRRGPNEPSKLVRLPLLAAGT